MPCIPAAPSISMTCNNPILPPNSPLSRRSIQMDTSISDFQSLSSTESSQKPTFGCSLKRKRPPKIQIPSILQEISVDTQIKLGSSPSKNDTVCCFEDMGVGVCSIKGKKKFMEDTYKIVSSIDGDSKKGFFGVYDGHGGKRAAEFVSQRLHKNVIEMVDRCDGNWDKEAAVKAAYLKTDKDFLEQEVSSGSCCVTVLINGTEMVVSNLGDCRAVLCRGGVAEALTKDHRAEMEEERKRIEDMGGYVEFHKGAWRVHGILTVSRSIGDAHLKDWVVSQPDTTISDLTPDMDFLVLASDGLWEEVGNQEAIDIVQQYCVVDKKSRLQSEDLDRKSQRNLMENDDENVFVSTSSSPKVKRISLIKQKHKKTLAPSLNYMKTENSSTSEGLSEFDKENQSPPAKLRRTSLFSHKNMKTPSPSPSPSPSYRKTENTFAIKGGLSDFNNENASPIAKLKASLFSPMCMKNESPSRENKRPNSTGLLAACKKLVNLAASRGSIDDITVMVVDLKHFRSGRPVNALSPRCEI